MSKNKIEQTKIKRTQKYYRCYHCKQYKLPEEMLKRKNRRKYPTGIANICYECKKIKNKKYTEGCKKDRRGNYSHTSPTRKTRIKNKMEHPSKTFWINIIIDWAKKIRPKRSKKYIQIGLESPNDTNGNVRELVSIVRNYPNIKKEGIDKNHDYVNYWCENGVDAKKQNWDNYTFINDDKDFTICYINRFGSLNDEHLIINALSSGIPCIVDLYVGRNGNRERYRKKTSKFPEYNVCFILLPHTPDVAPNMRMVFFTKKELGLLPASINNLAFDLYTEAPLPLIC